MKLIIDISEELYAKVPTLVNKGSIWIRDVLDAVENGTPLEAQPIHSSTYGGVSWGGIYRDEAQPTDAVSRELALLALTGMDLPTDRDKLIALFVERIQHLPSVQPQPCEDCISRESMLSLQTEYAEKMDATTFWKLRDDIRELPSVKPKYTDEEIDKAQAVEQAYVDKMVELAVEELKRPKGKWLARGVGFTPYECSECEAVEFKKSNFCPDCGAEMRGENNGNMD